MAKFKADITFEGIKEKKFFKKDEEFEMTVERANEIQKNIKDKYGIEQVMTRLDDNKADEPKKDEKPSKQASKK